MGSTVRQGMAAAVAGAVALASCHLPLSGLEATSEDGGGKPVQDARVDHEDDARDDVALDGPVIVGPPDFAWYRLDETSGTTAHDSTGHHYDVTNLLGVTWGQGASFDGTGGGGFAVVGPGLRQAPVSLTAWLAPDSRVDLMATSHGIAPFPPNAVSGDVPGAFGYGLGLNVWSGGSALSVENVGYDFQGPGGAPFVVATEYFVAAAIDTTTASVYVNGQLVAQAASRPPGPSATTTLALGFHNSDPLYGTKRFYAGRMRDVRVYKRVLVAAEMAALYSAGPQ